MNQVNNHLGISVKLSYNLEYYRVLDFSDIDGLKRKLMRKLSLSEDGNEMDWEV